MSQTTVERKTRLEKNQQKRNEKTFYQFVCCTYLFAALDIKVEKDEIIITATTACLPMKSEIKKSVGRSKKSVDLDFQKSSTILMIYRK